MPITTAPNLLIKGTGIFQTCHNIQAKFHMIKSHCEDDVKLIFLVLGTDAVFLLNTRWQWLHLAKS